MGWEAWATLTILAAVLVLLVATERAPWVILLGGLTALFSLGIVTEREALAGFSNPGMITVGVMLGATAGLRETGAIAWLAGRLLGHPRTAGAAMARLFGPVALLSAFMNNTPLVAVMLPVTHDWARKHGFSPSRFLMPMAFAATLGGLCTLIGTSTILVVDGLLLASGRPGMGMFDVTWVGIPCLAAGFVFLLAAARWLVPDRRPVVSIDDDARSYTVEMMVEPGSGIEGRSIQAAGLRHLPGLYLMEIDREGQVIPAVSSSFLLKGGDRLVFVGVIESVVDLQKIRGLSPATSQVFKLGEPRSNRRLVEAVVSDTCPLVGQTIREGRFRARYNAAVIAVGRSGERLQGKLGDVVLRAGDLLLLEARASFADQHRNSRDFYLVSRIEDSAPPRHERAPIALLILAGLVVAVTAGWMDMLNAALIAALLMVATRCSTAQAALRSVDWQVLLVIAASFGIGTAIDKTGIASGFAVQMLAAVGGGPHAALAALMATTLVLTNLIQANTAAVLMFPVALETASRLGAGPMPFAMAVMIGAAASFATPIAYQTNLMVMGPGGYRFSDYLKVGLPLTILVFLVALVVIPLRFPF